MRVATRERWHRDTATQYAKSSQRFRDRGRTGLPIETRQVFVRNTQPVGGAQRQRAWRSHCTKLAVNEQTADHKGIQRRRERKRRIVQGVLRLPRNRRT